MSRLLNKLRLHERDTRLPTQIRAAQTASPIRGKSASDCQPLAGKNSLVPQAGWCLLRKLSIEADEGASLHSFTAPAATSMDQEAATTEAAPRRCRASEDGQRRAGGGAVAVAARRGRCFDVVEAPTTTGRRCRSCAAVAIADCVALGCCPCAVVSLLALALVKAPLVVGRLRRRRRLLLHQKRVRDHEEEEEGVGNGKATMTAAASAGGTGAAEAELAWLEEMYRVGHWGFGRVSFSGEKENPVRS